VSIRLASTDEDIAACHGVMRELRPHLDAKAFFTRVRRQQQSGYQLAMLEAAGRVVCVAGYRLGENLAWGRFLYVDDLVTLADARSVGHGRRMLDWLRGQARQAGCQQLHMDSGVQRREAHRFYLREGLCHTSLHFAQSLQD